MSSSWLRDDLITSPHFTKYKGYLNRTKIYGIIGTLECIWYLILIHIDDNSVNTRRSKWLHNLYLSRQIVEGIAKLRNSEAVQNYVQNRFLKPTRPSLLKKSLELTPPFKNIINWLIDCKLIKICFTKPL